ncbi:MAG: hypothetical protein M0R70_00805 [Nitrospirae bacterium]|nr:hypothetical protein [Nitrospirota bacterium]
MLVSKRKRYLSGSDWVINTFDHLMKASTCAGNMSQVVLQFDSLLDEDEVRTQVSRFAGRFPVLQGSVGRDLKLAPYWRIPAKGVHEVTFVVHRVDDRSSDNAFPLALAQSVNTAFRDDNDHLAFHLFIGHGRSMLAMTFDHRILDARGAELFLDLFQKSLKRGAPEVSGDIAFVSSSALTRWSKRFLAGRNVNRRIMMLSKTATPEALHLPSGKDRCYRYHLLAFNEKETAGIYERAYTEAGYLMESPYLLSVIIQSMRELFKSRQLTGASYLIPVTMDLRPGLDPLQEVFFNYVSYLFYQVPVLEIDDRKGLIALLKQQMYDQVKSGFPKDLVEASLLTRIAPLPVLGKLLHLPMKGKMATFVFSHLGKSAYQHPVFMEKRIANMFHMPRVPVPPGLGFFSNYYNNRLNLVISSLDGLLSDEDIRMLEEGIRDRFGVSKAS